MGDGIMTEIYACVGCGANFAAGYGPDNIVESPRGSRFEAERDGDCPVCDETNPDMILVRGGTSDNRHRRFRLTDD